MTLGFTQTINGQPNYFIEKIWAGLLDSHKTLRIGDYKKFQDDHQKQLGTGFPDYDQVLIHGKLHTIREDSHDRWYPGMNIQFVINNRTPKRFQFAPVIPCKSVQRISLSWSDLDGIWNLPNVYIDGKILSMGMREQLAINDGFDSVGDFFLYFNKDFAGKIIHWTDLKY